MRAPLLFAVSLLLGGATLACGALTGVDWERVVVHGDGGSSGASGSSGGTSGSSGGTSGSSGVPGGSCTDGQVECLSSDGVTCCPNGGDPGLPVSLAAGGQTTCAIAASGQIKCWGVSGSGQLGRDTRVGSNTPQLVFRIPKGATQLTVGGSHVCAIVDSLLTCWGGNENGQFGNGSTSESLVPIVVQLSALPDSISAGSSLTCASLAGKGYCWGANSGSQAGNETEPLRVLTPSAVKSLPSLATSGQVIAAGRDHACASSPTQLFCWGTNSSNRLGVSGTTQSAAAVMVVNGRGPASKIALGASHGCALQGDAVQCWGDNIFGELGNDSGAVGAVTPTNLGGGVTSICTGTFHTCVVQGGVVKCFGDNSQGQAGIAPGNAHVATPVQALSGFVAKEVACGDLHSCALSETGAIKCWGQNASGQLGDGSGDMKSSTPRDVKW